MAITARDVMDTRYFTVRPTMPVSEAIKIFRKATDTLDRRVFGMMVVNDENELVGMISIHDILILMRPKHIHIWGEMSEIDISGYAREAFQRLQSILVEDLMTTGVVSVTPDTELLLIADIMTRRHIRRIPVLEAGKVIGIVHMSNVFFSLVGENALY